VWALIVVNQPYTLGPSQKEAVIYVLLCCRVVGRILRCRADFTMLRPGGSRA
jgi:hypothetical protein